VGTCVGTCTALESGVVSVGGSLGLGIGIVDVDVVGLCFAVVTLRLVVVGIVDGLFVGVGCVGMGVVVWTMVGGIVGGGTIGIVLLGALVDSLPLGVGTGEEEDVGNLTIGVGLVESSGSGVVERIWIVLAE